MTLTLNAIRNCTHGKTAAPHAGNPRTQFFGQPSKCARVRTSNLFYLSHRSWSGSLEKINKRAVRPSAGIFKHAEHSKPYTCGLPCLSTCRHKDRNARYRSRSGVVRSEMDWKRHCPEQALRHEVLAHIAGERKCNRRDHAHSDHTPGCAGCEGCDSELREWKGMKDARHEQIGLEAESEWQGEEDPHREYTPRHGGGEDKARVLSTLSVADKGYVIKVSKELMGLFCYIEKRKRTMIKELADTLRQIAAVSLAITCVRGIFSPLVEVFRTTPPTWSKLLLMLVSFDSIAICYLAIKSAEPLEKLATITTENRRDIMESVEKEEEMILKIAVEFIRLFKRLRNIAVSITVSQTAQLIFTVLRMKDPNFVGNCLRVVQIWMQAPWT
ncbi:hypothetical protein KC19_VG029200 [Ceratodon purpureus]|uniref:Uncharacterized protein n=1 Tax=Ceratodon purpureus TaxID=3225 RepID=A0A8T0HLM3_CERPU|nr:hypothetical protein KC19_VG029200 [Ceratodon purpureus]